MTTRRRDLTVDDIEAGYLHESHDGRCDGWLGFGYLGERRHWPADIRRENADAAILAVANLNRWTAERLFTWLNSKPGRWYGDMTLGSSDGRDFGPIAGQMMRARNGTTVPAQDIAAASPALASLTLTPARKE